MLFEGLASDLMASTNMGLEGILSQMKAAVPKGKSKSSTHAEKLAWLSFLGQRLHQHVERGRRDCRLEEKRTVLLETGVPLEHQHGQSWTRPDMRWLMGELRAWRLANAAADKTEEATERERLFSLWASWDELQRVSAVSALETGGESGTAPERKRKKKKEKARKVVAPEEAWWDCGDEDFPLRPAILQEHLQSHMSNSSRGIAGLANKAQRAREAERGKLIIRDKNSIAPDKVYTHRHACTELHPGLCAFRDMDIYRNALLLDKNLEIALTEKYKHSFCCSGLR
jgi:hypothetical protein